MQINDVMVDISKISNKLMNQLALAQKICPVQIILTDGFRTVEQDKALGDSGNTAHVRGLAVDIRCRTSQDRYAIIKALLAAGFNRIGDEATHIHADIDTSLPSMVIWRQ